MDLFKICPSAAEFDNFLRDYETTKEDYETTKEAYEDTRDHLATNHRHSVSLLDWVGGVNLVPTASANNQEWSIDLTSGSYTGCYWHVWSGKNSKSILRCNNDDCNVEIANGRLLVRHLGTSYIAGLTNPAVYQTHPSSSSWSPIIAWRTKSQGGWSLGSYDNDYAQFAFGTSANISAGTNTVAIVNLRPINGTIALVPNVLYNNGTGTNGTVGLSSSAANFNHMRIFYKKNGDSQAKASIDVFSPNGNRFGGSVVNSYSSSGGQFIGRTYTISGTSISAYNGAESYVNVDTAGGNASGGKGNSSFYIYRVEAWND